MALQASQTNFTLFLRRIVIVRHLSLCYLWLSVSGFVWIGAGASLSPPRQALLPLAWDEGAVCERELPPWHRDKAALQQDCRCRLRALPAENPKQTTVRICSHRCQQKNPPWNHTGSTSHLAAGAGGRGKGFWLTMRGVFSGKTWQMGVTHPAALTEILLCLVKHEEAGFECWEEEK